jgi:hypothetical protein
MTEASRVPLQSVLRELFASKVNTVPYLLKARTAEAEKQPLLGNARTQQ